MGKVIMSGIVPPLKAPVTGIQLGTIAEGQIVKINENGTPVDFYVAKHDYESSLNGTGRTLLVRRDCYDTRAWTDQGANIYASSSIDRWLNESYKRLLDPDVQNVVGISKFYYTPGNGNNRVSTLERAIFILSVTELGKVHSFANTEGTALPAAGRLQIAHYNGSAVMQWTRSPYTNADTTQVYCLFTDGKVYYKRGSEIHGARPCFTLPGTALFDETTLILKGA